MLQDTRIALFLLEQLIEALQSNDSDTFKRWLYGGIQDLGEPAVTELLVDWIDPFITKVEADSVSTNTNFIHYFLTKQANQVSCLFAKT